LQLIEAQQVCVFAPHGVHSSPAHKNPAAHIDPAQHVCPIPPQLPQVPFSQASSSELHVVPQQVCPVPPQGTHVSVAAQASPVSQSKLPAQHAWSSPPQAVQLPPEQTVPSSMQVSSSQQGSSLPPHATHSSSKHA
jgi:hypothetical protein